MQLNELAPKHKQKKSKRIGRGGKRGTYSGRGLKGQKSRSGRRFQPIIRQVIKRYPKLRGYKFNQMRNNTVAINTGDLENKFIGGEKITPKLLLANKLIRRKKGKIPQVKILAKGALTKKFIISDCSVSEKAKEVIEKAGGQIKITNNAKNNSIL